MKTTVTTPTVPGPATVSPTGMVHLAPAYGHITINRQNGSRDRLFGVSGTVYNYVSVTVSTADLMTDVGDGSYRVRPRARILEFILSPLQLAEAISTMNCGEGTPCTLVWREGMGDVPPVDEPTTRCELIEAKFRADMLALARNCDEFLTLARALRDKPTITKSDRELFVKTAENLVKYLHDAAPYAASEFTATVERMLAEVTAATATKQSAADGEAPSAFEVVRACQSTRIVT